MFLVIHVWCKICSYLLLIWVKLLVFMKYHSQCEGYNMVFAFWVCKNLLVTRIIRQCFFTREKKKWQLILGPFTVLAQLLGISGPFEIPEQKDVEKILLKVIGNCKKLQNSLQTSWKLLFLSKFLLGETRACLEVQMVSWCNCLAFKFIFLCNCLAFL